MSFRELWGMYLKARSGCKRWHAILFSASVLVFLKCAAQGIINFSNSVDGVNAPVSSLDGGLLGVGFLAQLQRADGSKVGEPAPFVANGLFFGGNRTIPNVAPGRLMTLQVAFYNVDREWIGTSDFLEVVVGSAENPGKLTGMRPLTVTGPQQPIYEWTNPGTLPGSLVGLDRFFCRHVGNGSLEFTAIVVVDDCFCGALAFPGDPQQLVAPCPREGAGLEDPDLRIAFAVTSFGDLEIRWSAASNLFRSSQIVDPDERIFVESVTEAGGMNVATFPMNDEQQFFWIE